MSAACPACGPAPKIALPRNAPARPDIVLQLPDIHCAACIASVEDTLAALPGVRDARVNYGQRRVAVAGAGLRADALIEALARAGHRARPLDADRLGGPSAERRALILRIGVAGFAMMNVMLLSVAVWSGAAGATAGLFHLLSAAIALPAVAFSARPFFASGLAAIRAGRLNMDVPISLAILLASGASLAGALGVAEAAQGWFDAALALTFFLLVGRFLDAAGRQAARSAAAELAALDTPQAIRLEDGAERVVRAEDLRPGDLIRLRPGDRVPADGSVEAGRAALDRSALTGETAPEAVAPGGAVAAGEVALDGALTVRVARAGRDTALSRLADLVAAAEGQRSRHSGLADRAARVYAPLVHALGAAAFAGWWLATGDGWRALDVAISVLVITCPCALGLAVPAVSTVATGRLFRRGILLTSPTALERLSEIDAVAFDKTGTLTTGAARLDGTVPDAVLSQAAALARHSAHPYSRALVAAAEARALPLPEAGDLREIPGRGLTATLAGRRMRLGHPGWIGTEGEGIAFDDGSRVHAFAFAEELRPGAADCVAALRARGLAVAILSGDAQGPVDRIARTLGVGSAHARMTPLDKAAWLDARAAQGARVLMVGDGLNDTGALSKAHASLSPGSALEAARMLSDAVLICKDLGAVPMLLATARGAARRMRENIALAAAYNAVAIPVALAGHATPLVAAIAMSASSLTVTLNALRRIA